MKKAAFLLMPFALAAAACTARADVSWTHTGRISLGTGTPIASFIMKNEWSGQRHRTRVFVDASGASAFMGGATDSVKGTFDLIERLDDDKIILAPHVVGMPNSFVEEQYSTLKSRLRLNVWEGIDDKLASEPVPELTPEQRSRLGREIRASLSPITKRMVRYYFRQLPQKRTIMGMESTGYRFTTAVRIPDKKAGDQWVRAAMEFWLAGPQDGDSDITGFNLAANQIRKGPTSVSMWANEMLPIMYETLPEEFKQVMTAMFGDKNAPDFGFKGTPMQISLTITPPPVAQMMVGEVRIQTELKGRSVSPVDPALFNAPTDGKRVPLDPYLQMAKNAMKQGRAEMEKELDKEF